MKWTAWIIPRIDAVSLRRLTAAAAAGAGIAGAYGIAHDQITYSLAPEYFTHFKFAQFDWTARGLPERLRVAEIGFHATWWVGALGGWMLGRLTCGADGRVRPVSCLVRDFRIIAAASITAGFAGYLHASWEVSRGDMDGWEPFREAFGLTDLDAFALVGSIHNFGYAGALVGLVAAVVIGRRRHRTP